jgi:hypothetical protein
MLILFEKFVEAADHLIGVLFSELDLMFDDWISNGSFKSGGCERVQSKDDVIMNPMQKTKTIEFMTAKNYFHLSYIVRVDDFSDDNEIDILTIKLTMYDDLESGKKLGEEIREDVKVEDIDDSLIVDIIAEIYDRYENNQETEDIDLNDTKSNTFQ